MKGHQHQMFILSIQITGRKKSRCLSWKFRPHRAPKSSLYCYECEGEFCQQSEQGSNWMKSLERYILYTHTTSVVLKSTDCHFQTMFLFQNISITELSMPTWCRAACSHSWTGFGLSSAEAALLLWDEGSRKQLLAHVLGPKQRVCKVFLRRRMMAS